MPNHNGSPGNQRSLFARFWKSASRFWLGKSALVGWSLIFILVAIAIGQVTVQYRLNYWNRDFFNALEVRDASALGSQAILFVPLASFSIALSVSAVWGRLTTQRKWREWLTVHLLNSWFTNDRFRRLKFASDDSRNPEYRISYDARMATDAPVDLAMGLLTALLTAGLFINVLWTVGGSFTLSLAGLELTVPGYLVIGATVYVLVFTTAILAIGRKLLGIIQAQNQAEAELRATADRIQHIGSEPDRVKTALQKDVWEALRQVLYRWRQLCWQLMGTTLVSQSDVLIAPVFGWLLCVPKYLAGTMTLGELTQASAAFVTVQAAFNWFVDNYPRLADWRSAVNRVASLLLALDEVSCNDTAEHVAAAAANELDREPALGAPTAAP
jgi:vitamin B12/bleomycin/antimicrobial peptide transport system ATP-binding/permease protein